MKSLIQAIKAIRVSLFGLPKTSTIITLISRGERLEVRMAFKPKLDPKNITIDQAAGAEAVRAIKNFLNEYASDPSDN